MTKFLNGQDFSPSILQNFSACNTYYKRWRIWSQSFSQSTATFTTRPIWETGNASSVMLPDNYKPKFRKVEGRAFNHYL